MAHVPLGPYGWNERWEATIASAAPGGAQPARVLRHDSSALLVAGAGGPVHVSMAGALEPVTVGDWVAVVGSVAVAVLPRSSLLRRLDPRGGSDQLLAANVDVVVVVAGLDRPLKSGRLQRAVTLAWDAGAAPLVVLSKADLAADPEAARREVADQNPGVDVLLTSARHGEGVPELEEAVRDRTVVVLGESGAGKSTLVNALAGTTVAAAGRVRTGDAKGRHTTTFRQLHLLPGGGCVIDTPGLRAVGLVGTPQAVARTFSDVEELAAGCRFDDCAHQGEPGCSVVLAVEQGGLAPARLEAWQAMDREARSAALRADEYARRRADRRFGRMARQAQRDKGRS